jgi:Mn2+/Fe2+ NRAMP family transporter
MITNPANDARRPGLNYVLSILGPGILYAGAAVGISHLVQATRAGAVYGLGMTSLILLACLMKYPALRFGGEFSAASGKTLIQNYRETGWWAIGLYVLTQVFSMCFAIAAVTLVTVGVIKTTFNITAADLWVAIAVLAMATIFLLSGRYHLLERLTKLIVAVFTVLIAVTTVLVISRIEWSWSGLLPPAFTPGTIAFVIALIGFMPTPMDACVLQSLWTVAQGKDRGRMPTPAESRLDFTIGFTISGVLAFCFMLMGVGIMYRSGIEPVQGAAGFAAQVIALFTTVIGDWVYPIIAVAALAVMFSTLLTILDGYPRMLEAVVETVLPPQTRQGLAFKVYDACVILVAAGVIAVISLFMRSFTAFIDMTAAIVFLTGPILAWLNHRAMWSEDVPVVDRPGLAMRIWSIVGIIMMVVLAGLFIHVRLTI